jgi:hypothetical protein
MSNVRLRISVRWTNERKWRAAEPDPPSPDPSGWCRRGSWRRRSRRPRPRSSGRAAVPRMSIIAGAGGVAEVLPAARLLPEGRGRPGGGGRSCSQRGQRWASVMRAAAQTRDGRRERGHGRRARQIRITRTEGRSVQNRPGRGTPRVRFGQELDSEWPGNWSGEEPTLGRLVLRRRTPCR